MLTCGPGKLSRKMTPRDFPGPLLFSTLVPDASFRHCY